MNGWTSVRLRNLPTRARCELLAVLAVWFAVAGAFASGQELWLDETTQLGGLGLGPLRVVSWLATDTGYRPDVPVDRMPPLSYWLGWLWSRPFGASEASMRAFGVLLVGVATAFVFSAARRAFGSRAGLISGVAFALSPNVIVAAAEIRAYPLLLALAAVAFYLLVRLHDELEARKPGLWVALAVTSVAACYTHFFGLVLAGAVFVAALTFNVVRRHALKAWALSAAMVAITSAGLAPFVAKAVARSTSGEPTRLLSSFVRLAYRTAGGHPALSVYDWALGGALLAAVIGLGCALFLRPNGRVGLGLIVALGSGFAVVVCVKLVTGGFDALSPSYNLWMLPAVFIALGALARLGAVRSGALALAPIGLLWVSNAGATFVLLENRSAFAHTAAARLEARVRDAGISRIAVVHEPTGSWAHGYFPLNYRFGKELRQYLAAVAADGHLELRELPHLTPVTTPETLDFGRVLVVSSEQQGADELKAFIRSARPPRVGDDGVERALAGSGFRAERSETFMALFATRVVSMQRVH